MPHWQGYGRWHHIDCWRIPASIWLALPDPDVCKVAQRFEAAIIEMQQIAMCGFFDLSPEHKQEFIAHCMDKKHYAKAKKNSKAYNAEDSDAEDSAHTSASASATTPAASSAASGGRSALASSSASFGAAQMQAPSPAKHSSTSALALYTPPPTTQLSASAGQGGCFLLPRPGVNGALENAFHGKTFVLTGIFPEVGGGTGLNLGKDKVKAMIESFGGRVTASVSGRTNYVLVGAEPGSGKVSAARERGIPTPDIQGLKLTLETRGAALEHAAPARITSLSSGFKDNGLGRISHEQPMGASGNDANAGGGAAATGSGKAKKKRAAAKSEAHKPPKAPKQPRVSKKAAAAAAASSIASADTQ